MKKFNITGEHFLVEGLSFSSMAIYRMAMREGYKGTYTTIYSRLKRGDDTWKRIFRPPGNTRRKSDKRKHDEMSAVCAALDARKKSMGL